jgi:replicative DNA helicase
MIQRIPTHDTDLESSILGTLLLSERVLSEVIEILSPEKFYEPKHRDIFSSILSLYKSSIPIDLLTLTKQLRSEGKLESVGGALFISNLTNRIASTANLQTWCLQLSEMYMKRRFNEIASDIFDKTYDDTIDVFDIYDAFMTQMNDVFQNNLKTEVVHISGIVTEASKSIEYRMSNEQEVSGYSTSIHSVDMMLGGHQKSDLMYMAGRPAMGKTAMALSEVLELGKRGVPVAFFSLEMSSVQLAYRLASMISGVSAEKLMKYKLDKYSATKYYKAVDILNKLPIYIDDSAGLSVFDLKAKVKRMKQKHGIEIVYVDYVQLMSLGGKKTGLSREQELSAISRNLKLIAKESNIPMIVLSQLSRAVESRQDKRPILADLRESGSLEQDADVVTFLFRPEYYGIDTMEGGHSTEGLGEYIIAKQRNGGTGICPMRFHHNIMKYTDIDFYPHPVEQIPDEF